MLGLFWWDLKGSSSDISETSTLPSRGNLRTRVETESISYALNDQGTFDNFASVSFIRQEFVARWLVDILKLTPNLNHNKWSCICNILAMKIFICMVLTAVKWGGGGGGSDWQPKGCEFESRAGRNCRWGEWMARHQTPNCSPDAAALAATAPVMFTAVGVCVHLCVCVCVCVCVFTCVCVCGHVYVVYEDTNLYNDMGYDIGITRRRWFMRTFSVSP